MKEIQLTQGKVALVDDEDFEELSKYKWSFIGVGYAIRFITVNKKRKIIYMHRKILNITQRTIFVDHINQNKLDNRKENLRYGRGGENLVNRAKNANNKSGYKGVYKIGNKWYAAIGCNYKKIWLGTFDNKIEAAKAYNTGALKYFGNFAFQNDV